MKGIYTLYSHFLSFSFLCVSTGILIRNNKSNTKKYCKQCSGYIPQDVKTVVCVDCGKEFEIDARNNQSCRCEDCYTIYRRNKVRENVQRYREKHDM